MTREEVAGLVAYYNAIGGHDKNFGWVREIISNHADGLPPMDDEHMNVLDAIARDIIARAKSIQTVRDLIADHHDQIETSERGVAARREKKNFRHQLIREAHEAAARQGRKATIEELMAAGNCKKDTVYRALKPTFPNEPASVQKTRSKRPR